MDPLHGRWSVDEDITLQLALLNHLLLARNRSIQSLISPDGDSGSVRSRPLNYIYSDHVFRNGHPCLLTHRPVIVKAVASDSIAVEPA